MDKRHLHTAQNISLSLALVGLHFPMNISSGLIILFCILSIIKQWIFKEKITKQHQGLLFVFLGAYIWYIIGFMRGDSANISLLERNVSWLLIPLVVFFTVHYCAKKRYKQLLFFALATHVIAAIYALYGLMSVVKTGEMSQLIYEGFTQLTGFHPVYFSMYLIISLAIIAYGVYKKYIHLNKKAMVGLVIIDSLFLVMLSSKMVLFTFVLSLVYFAFKQPSLKRILFISLVFIGLSMVGFKSTRERIADEVFSKWELLSKDQFLYNDAFTGTTLRLITWKFVMQQLATNKNLFFGVGSERAQPFIDQVYTDHNMDDAEYLGFNMHNQWLEYWVKFGFVGLCYFIVLFYGCFRVAIQSKNQLFVFFMIVFTMVSFTESNLEVHRGLLFFVLFSSFFMFSNTSATSKMEAS